MDSIIQHKHIVLCVCGGIAAYKSVELLRLMVKQKANVRVLMTRHAADFVQPLTFEALSGQPVCTSLFEHNSDASIRHIDWAQKADAVVVAPATANFIGKLAGGIADDAASTFMLAVTSPVIICPSMNTHMYENRAVQKNLDILESYGHMILEPAAGELACGTTGPGRLPEPEHILDRIICLLTPKDLKGKHVLVTAGPTREPIDPVRFISNPSSGRMGFAVAKAAEHRGASVTLIAGPTTLANPVYVQTIRIKTAEDMACAVFEHIKQADIIIKTAAVSDYTPVAPALQKIKKTENTMTLSLKKTKDILKEIGKIKKDRIVVGFAAETEMLEKNATQKLFSKNLDIIAGNIIGAPSSGFEVQTNEITLFYKDGSKEALDIMDKEEIAHIILDRVLALYPKKS
jgi:phosphopantothenoylcysteine decarboxylase/phosphopantothenate--cysteine ligase